MTVLCYHAVDPDWISPLAVPPEAFERHCRWLARNRRVLELPDAVARMDRTGGIPGGGAALTFDDGFSSVYGQAFPSLLRHRLPATVFVVARTLTEPEQPVDWVDAPPPFPLTTLTAAQILEMHEAGVRFGSHSHAHHDLTTLSEAECERDLRTSREVLEELLGHPVRFLAYPRGRHEERVRRAAERAGYLHSFSLPDGPEPAGPQALPRAGVYHGNGSTVLRVKTARWYLPLRTSRARSLLQHARRTATGGGRA